MTQPIDIAYVDVVVRDGELKNLERDVDKTMKKIDKGIESDLEKIDAHFTKTSKKATEEFNQLGKDVEKQFTVLDRAAEKIFAHIDENIGQSTRSVRGRFKELRRDIEDLANSGERDLNFLQRGFAALGGVVGELGKALGQLGSQLGGAISSSPFAALIIVLIPAIIALAAALTDLIGIIGLVPSGLLVLAAAIAPLIIAFQNFGGAVSALASGDVKKIDEALKKLAPSARIVAKEIADLIPVLQQLQRTVQQQFFMPLIGGFTQLNNVLIPTLTAGMSWVAAALGRMVRSILDFFSLAENTKLINDLFATTARIIDNLSPKMLKFIQGFLEVGVAALPIFERLVGVLLDAFGRFGDFMTRAAQSGDLAKFIEDAVKTFRELLDLVKAVGGLLGTLFAGTKAEGHDFIKTLTDLTIRLDNFFKSADGRDVINDLVLVVKLLGATLGATLNTLVFLTQSLHSVWGGLEFIGRSVVLFVKTFGEWLSKIPGVVVEFIGGIPKAIGDALSAAFNAALIGIGVGIAAILFLIMDLPNQIIMFLIMLPSRISDALASTGPTMGNIFLQALQFVKDVVVNGFNEIVNFIGSIPDRIVALAPKLYMAGLGLIQAFMNGFRSVNNFIGDVAGDIVRAIKGFLNKAIDKINVGIAAVDEFLPGDLPRIPRLAQGALIRARPGGTAAIIGEGGKDEIVAPLDKLNDIVGGPTVNFGPGAISISFSGVVPTEAEARATGEAVGQGISSMLTRRNIRAQVRAI